MAVMDITPLTPIEALYVAGQLSKRACQCCTMLHLVTVRDVASFHYSDPRYSTMAGCGKRTARELNAAIKAAYGRFPSMKQIEESQEFATSAAGSSWQARWEAQASAPTPTEVYEVPADSIAAEWDACGTLTASERRFAKECAEYAQFILTRRGIPASMVDINRHKWYLRHSSALDHLGEHCRLLFAEMLDKVKGANFPPFEREREW